MDFVFASADALGEAEEIALWKAKAKAGCDDTLASALPSLRAGLEKQLRIQKAFLDDITEPQAELIHFAGAAPVIYAPKAEPGKRYTSLLGSIAHPLSRGTCHISSADPRVPPAINPNYYSNDADLDMHVRLVQSVLKLYETSPLKEHVNKVVLPDKETCEKGAEGIREFIKNNCATTYHPLGTAAMVPREDGGVVDPTLKVYGTSNLRVVDASILPIVSPSCIDLLCRLTYRTGTLYAHPVCCLRYWRESQCNSGFAKPFVNISYQAADIIKAAHASA